MEHIYIVLNYTNIHDNYIVYTSHEMNEIPIFYPTSNPMDFPVARQLPPFQRNAAHQGPVEAAHHQAARPSGAHLRIGAVPGCRVWKTIKWLVMS